MRISHRLELSVGALVREEPTHIPTELLRTVVAVVEAGSFTKAAARLGISQPGVSAHVKKLQALIRGVLFERSPSGVVLTERGKALLPLARRILDANDQILRVSGAAGDQAPIRIGTNVLFSPLLVEAVAGEKAGAVTIQCDEPDRIEKNLQEGYLDIGCLVAPRIGSERLVAKWDEELVWVRARDFVLSPGRPVPIVGMPGQLEDRIATAALQQKGLDYRHVFVAPDFAARTAAVACGMGLMPMMARRLTGDVVVAQEYYMPPLGKLEAGICVRDGMDRARLAPLLQRLVAKLVPPPMPGAEMPSATPFKARADKHAARRNSVASV